jgi:hypothetical protein
MASALMEMVYKAENPGVGKPGKVVKGRGVTRFKKMKSTMAGLFLPKSPLARTIAIALSVVSSVSLRFEISEISESSLFGYVFIVWLRI